MAVLIADASKHNGRLVDLAAFVASEFAGLVCRVTVGTYYVDSEWEHNRRHLAALPADRVRGGYHVIRCDELASKQLDCYCKAVGDLDSLDFHVIDFERGYRWPKFTARQAQEAILVFGRELKKLTARRVLLYTNIDCMKTFLAPAAGVKGFQGWMVEELPLWLALPDAAKPRIPAPYQAGVLWQKTWTRPVPGFKDPSMDHSEWIGGSGNRVELLAYFGRAGRRPAIEERVSVLELQALRFEERLQALEERARALEEHGAVLELAQLQLGGRRPV